MLAALLVLHILWGRMGNSDATLLEFKAIPLVELERVIKASKPTTCMLDPLPSRVLKELLPTVGPAILSLMNLSFSTGIVPIQFKLLYFSVRNFRCGGAAGCVHTQQYIQ